MQCWVCEHRTVSSPDMSWWTSRGQNGYSYMLCRTSELSYTVQSLIDSLVWMKKEARFSFTYSSCPLFRYIPLSMHSTSSKHSSLRGHDPKCDSIWGLNRVIKPAGSCQKGCSLPPTTVCSCCLLFVGAAAHVAAQLRQIQPLTLLEPNPAQRKEFPPARSVPWSHQSMLRWGLVPASPRQGGGDIQPWSWGWTGLPQFTLTDGLSPAKLQSLLAPEGLAVYFHTFPNFKLQLLGKPTVITAKVFANLMQTSIQVKKCYR